MKYVYKNNICCVGFDDPIMRINTGLRDEPELDPSTNFSRKSLPSIRTDLSPNVVGVLGKEIRLACYLTNLGNKTVSVMCIKATSMH